MTNPRTKARIEARIKERAAYCLEFEISDPRSAFITITKVQISNDLASAKVFYSVLGTESEKSKVRHMLEDASGFVQRQVGRVLKTRRTPRLSWFYDDSIEHAINLDRAIREAKRRDQAINPTAHGGEPVEDEDPDEEMKREYVEFLEAREEEQREKAAREAEQATAEEPREGE